MAQLSNIVNFDTASKSWGWTGRNSYNQFWSYLRVTEPILVTSIECLWGGYASGTSGRHFIAKYEPNSNLGGMVVYSGIVSVNQGRRWRTANIKDTFLEPGEYAVGVWADPRGRRQFAQWIDDVGLLVHASTEKNIDGNANGIGWEANGVLPVRLNYETAGRMSVKANGTWRTGRAYVNVNGAYREAKAVWVKSNGVWRMSK
jgi:hypothetical protein